MNGAPQMMRFRYRAVDAHGRVTRGTLLATGIDSARSKLMGLRLMPIEVGAERAVATSRRRIGDADLALGARILSDLLSSGLPVARALNAFEDLAPNAWRSHLRQLEEEVRAGASLSTALTNIGGAVPPLMIGLVRAGEIGGGLANAFDAAATLYDATASARTAIVSALTYPTFLLIVCVGSVGLLAGVVLPRFAALLADLGQRLPPTTAALLSVSAAAQQWGATFALALVAAAVAAWYWTTTSVGRRQYHWMLLRLPVIGVARHAWASASACATASALVQSGVILPAALQHAAAACNDAEVATRIAAARDDVLAGARPSDALDRHRALTSTAVKLLRAGEEAGNVPVTLTRAALLERARAMRVLQTTVKMLEPALVIAFGALVAFVATALLQAVYTIRPVS